MMLSAAGANEERGGINEPVAAVQNERTTEGHLKYER